MQESYPSCGGFWVDLSIPDGARNVHEALILLSTARAEQKLVACVMQGHIRTHHRPCSLRGCAPPGPAWVLLHERRACGKAFADPQLGIVWGTPKLLSSSVHSQCLTCMIRIFALAPRAPCTFWQDRCFPNVVCINSTSTKIVGAQIQAPISAISEAFRLIDTIPCCDLRGNQVSERSHFYTFSSFAVRFPQPPQ